ncbi:MAG TPA: sodium:proton antiporter [Sphingomonas sp.]|nr:sodium:proton antiporter [Sphingomonas sp.]
MHLFESLDAILLVALVLLVVARKLNVPYPTLLAAAGLGFAALPFAPKIKVDPDLALALFIAPALLYAAYNTSPRALKRHWFSLLALAVFAVLVTTLSVALVGVTLGGLPIAAAVALGAIVAPPDAAASEAVLGEVGVPRRGLLLLQGESLLNDATALLLFGMASAFATHSDTPVTPLALGAAVPGGIVFGAVAAWAYLRVAPLFAGTLGSSIADFAVTFGIWLLAERLHVSPVLAVVVFGMIVSRHRPIGEPARDRLQSAAVWSAAILVLNIVAFAMMGLQSRDIMIRLPSAERWPAIGFAVAVLATVLVTRIIWVMLVRLIEGVIAKRFAPSWLPKPAGWNASVILSWSGMRGLLTLATAFALPRSVPGRDLIVLAAFAVVIGTLVIQGLTLGPLIRRMKLVDDPGLANEIAPARKRLIEAGLAILPERAGAASDALRFRYGAAGKVTSEADDPQAMSEFDELHLEMIARQRVVLHDMRNAGYIAEDVYRRLQEELDWSEVDTRSFGDNILTAT